MTPQFAVHLFWWIFIPLLIGATIAVFRAFIRERRAQKIHKTVVWDRSGQWKLKTFTL